MRIKSYQEKPALSRAQFQCIALTFTHDIIVALLEYGDCNSLRPGTEFARIRRANFPTCLSKFESVKVSKIQ